MLTPLYILMAIVGFTLWGLHHQWIAGIILLMLVWLGFGAYASVSGRMRKFKAVHPEALTEDEISVICKYTTYVFAPITSVALGVTFSACRFICIGILLLFLWQHRWIEAGIAGSGWFLFGYAAALLDPAFFIAEANPELANADQLFESLRQKIRNA